MTDQSQWFVQKGGDTHGPFTSAQLRQLAGSSKISPTTNIRRGNDGHWVPAQNVKGLFTTTSASAKPTTTPNPPPAVRPQPLPLLQPASPPVPAVVHQTQPAMRMPCPFCGEEIATNAIKCRHCNEFLDGREQPQPVQAPFVMASSAANTTVVVQHHQQPKSIAVALILTWFFGPFGMFYSTPVGGLVMLGVWFVSVIFLVILTIVTVGLGAVLAVILVPILWAAQMVWAAVACNK